MESQLQHSETQESTHSDDRDRSELSLDEHLEQEQKEIAELDKANTEQESDEVSTGEESEGEGEEDGEEEGYTPSTKYKILDEEHEFDPKLKGALNKETEPIIRELYEKAHGLDAVKASRERVTQEREEIRGNYNNLVGEVGRIINYKKAGDLQSFFESVQLDDNTIAKYILEKAQIAQLPPEQQAVYNERETLRKRMNALEDNFRNVQTVSSNQSVQDRVAKLDTHLGDSKVQPYRESFDARNGKDAFKNAVMEYAAAKWHATQQDLTVDQAVQGFIKMSGLQVPKGQPKPGPNANKRVVSKPQVKTIPNYGGSQASITAQKPKSIADLKKIRIEKFGS